MYNNCFFFIYSDLKNPEKNVDTKTLHTKYLQAVLYKKEDPEPLVSFYIFFYSFFVYISGLLMFN